MRHLAVLLLPLSIACGMSEEKFSSKYAQYACERYANCDLLDAYGNVEQCEKGQEIEILQYVDSEACAFDGQAARDCVGELKDAVEVCEADPTIEAGSACLEVCQGEGA